MNRTFSWAMLVPSLVLALLAMPAPGAGQQQPPTEPGSPGSVPGWITKTAPSHQPQAQDAPPPANTLSSEQIALIQRISDYFNYPPEALEPIVCSRSRARLLLSLFLCFSFLTVFFLTAYYRSELITCSYLLVLFHL